MNNTNNPTSTPLEEDDAFKEDLSEHEISEQSKPSKSANLLLSLQDKWKAAVGWICCISVHILFGIHPIFSRYLQSQSPNKFPSMLLITSCHLAALVIYSPRIVYLLFVYVRNRLRERRLEPKEEEAPLPEQLSTKERLKKFGKSLKRFIPVTAFFISLVARSATNIMSSKFTSALFVQLFALATPFILALTTVFIYNRWFLGSSTSKESFGLKAWVSMIATVIGGLVIIIGSVVPKSEVEQPWYAFFYTYSIQWSAFADNITGWDALGISLSLISSVCLVWYMLCLRYMKQEEHSGASISVTGESLFILQLCVLAFTFLIPSLIVDDWTLWARLNTKDWLMFFGFTIFVYMLANHLNIFAISYLGASVVGSILALRLVSTIFFSIVILQESLKSIWQLLGSIIVLTSVSYFLYTEYRSEQERKRQALALSIIPDLEKVTDELQIDEAEQEEETMDRVELVEKVRPAKVTPNNDITTDTV